MEILTKLIIKCRDNSGNFENDSNEMWMRVIKMTMKVVNKVYNENKGNVDYSYQLLENNDHNKCGGIW